MALTAVILAAGKGTRMKSRRPKVLHSVAGRPMLSFVLDAAAGAGAEKVIVVAGCGAAEVAAVVGDRAEVVLQEEQCGTAHALLQAEGLLRSYQGDILVLPGDAPLLRGATLRDFYAYYRLAGTAAAVLTARLEDPAGYGRVIRDQDGRVLRIVEHGDATPEELTVREVNTGVYCFKPLIFSVLKRITPNNAQKEYYLPDAIRLLQHEGMPVVAWEAPEAHEFLGVNDRRQLAAAEAVVRRRVVEGLMDAGVTVLDPQTTYVHPGVVVGQDSVIYPFTFLEGETVIGAECCIGPWVRITDSRLGDRVTVHNAVVCGAVVADGATIGPFSHVRPGTVVGAGAKVGAFVEVKKALIGDGSKVPHLSYVGDAQIGRSVNLGAGTITCNYDGVQKWQTVIEDGAFIGSNTSLVAPVRVGEGAYIGAGSTITKDVPAGALGIARSRQKNIADWVKKKRRG